MNMEAQEILLNAGCVLAGMLLELLRNRRKTVRRDRKSKKVANGL